MKIYKNLDINNLESEVWKVITDFPDYFVSNLGRIKSFKKYKNGKILKQEKNKDNYLVIKINHKRLCIHRIVLKSFQPIDNDILYECNHIDGNKINNLSENLEWVFHSENIKKAYDLKLMTQEGETNGNTELKNCEVWLIKKILNSEYYCKYKKINQEYISKIFKVNRKVISDIKTGKTWKHVK